MKILHLELTDDEYNSLISIAQDYAGMDIKDFIVLATEKWFDDETYVEMVC